MLIGFGRELASIRFIVTRIVEAFILAPRNSAELSIYNSVSNLSLGFSIKHDDLAPIASAL